MRRQGNVALFCKQKRVDWCFQIVARSANGTLLRGSGRRSSALCTREKTTCLSLFPLFVAQRVIGQRRPLLKVETGWLMLPDRRQKCKWNLTSCRWKTKFGTLHTEKNYLLALFTFVHGAEGDRATLPSCASRNGSIDASKLSLEAQMERDFMQLEIKVGHFAHKKKLPACAFHLCSWRRGWWGNVALFCSWKRSNWCFQLVAGSGYCSFINAKGMQIVALYPWQTKHLFADH